jgi:hypothetical protein
MTASGDSQLYAGSLEAPAWTVALVGASVVLSGLLYFFFRARSVRRARGSQTVRRG